MSRHSRQSFLGPESEAILGGATVAIIGACGGGSHVAQQLAHVGIGTIVVIDPDEIDDTNLNRLVGATALDVAKRRAKVAIAERVIKAVRPETNVVAVKKLWQSASARLQHCDVVVGCLDSVRAKNELEAFCRRFLVPYVDIGMDVHGDEGDHLISGQVVLSMPSNPCLQCLEIVTDERLEREGIKYGQAGGRPQVVWPNGVLASTAVGLVVQLLAPWHPAPADSAYLCLDGNTGILKRSHRLAIAAAQTCPHYPANERGDPAFDVRALTEPDAAASPKVGWFTRLLDRLRNPS